MASTAGCHPHRDSACRAATSIRHPSPLIAAIRRALGQPRFLILCAASQRFADPGRYLQFRQNITGDVVHLNGKLKQERPIDRRTPAAGGTAVRF